MPREKGNIGGMNKKYWLLAGAVVAVAAVLCLVRISVPYVVTPGTDRYKAHWPIFGDRKVNQAITVPGGTEGLGFVIVNLRRATDPPAVRIRIRGEHEELIAERVVPGREIKDDQFTWVAFPVRGQAGEKMTAEMASPEAGIEAAMGVRFEEEGEQPLALAVKQRMLLIQFLMRQASSNNRAQTAGIGLAAAAAVAALSAASEMKRKCQVWITAAIFAAIILAGLGVRLWALSHLYGVSGGDPYNYLAIADRLLQGGNPFTADKRLPGWPLLVMPALAAGWDVIRAMRLLSLLSAAGAAAALYWLGRNLKLPNSVALIAGVMLLWQKDFFLTSLRPEPYTFYALLLTLSLALFFQLEKRWAQAALGVVLGYAAMTRQEGIVLAAVMGVCSLARFRTLGIKGLARIAVPGFVLMLPFFVSNYLAYGNPLFTPYFEGDRLQIVDSWEAWKDNAGGTWGVLGSAWRPMWNNLQRIEWNDAYLWAGMVLALGWWAGGEGLRRAKDGWAAAGRTGPGLVLALAAAGLYFVSPASFGDIVMKMSAGALIASLPVFIWTMKRDSIPILLVLASQVMIATWFHPFPKHYQQDWPIIMLMLAVLFVLPGRREPSTDEKPSTAAPKIFSRAGWLAPIMMITVALFFRINHALDDSNRATAADHVTYQALSYAQRLTGPYGFDHEYQAVSLMFKRGINIYPEDEKDQVADWLRERNLETIVTTNTNGPALVVPDEEWLTAFKIRAEAKDEQILEGTVYQRRRD